ncbi:MAG: hypothetical protein KIT72_18285 [Polyangiaceae bacterium]|nr:hypothetical protein [Polyangiaceae bacterium]MCW5792366.1 hypothetical protein [Polyangiaceae bacterium]
MTDHDEGDERTLEGSSPDEPARDEAADSSPDEPARDEGAANVGSSDEPAGREGAGVSSPDEPGDTGKNEPGKRTSLNWKSAALPVAITLLLSVFIVYPYVRNIQLFGAQQIAPADDKGVKLTNEGARLLEGIQEGGTLEGFQVEHLRGPIRDRLEVELERGGQRVRVFVSRQDRVSFEPPRKTQMYAVHYENAKPNADAVTSEEYIALVEAVAKVVERHERKVSMPKGL